MTFPLIYTLIWIYLANPLIINSMCRVKHLKTLWFEINAINIIQMVIFSLIYIHWLFATDPRQLATAAKVW